MSEKTFRIILVVVALIWGVFVLLPALADFVPKAWAAVEYVLPGDKVKVTVVVKDARLGEPVDDARVQIVLENTALVAITDKDGKASFESVPAGRARLLRVVKVDHEAALLEQPFIPNRRRARFDVKLVSDAGRRLYVGHENANGTTTVSVLDAASHLNLTPPGPFGTWENLPAVDIQATYSSQRLYVLAPDRLQVFSLGTGAPQREVQLPNQSGGMALSPNGDVVYIFAAARTGNTRWLHVVDARAWQIRSTSEVPTRARQARLVTSSDGQRVYVAGAGDDFLTVFEAQGSVRAGVVRLPADILDLTASRDGRGAYILVDRAPYLYLTDPSGTGPALPAPPAALEGAARIAYVELYSERWIAGLKPGSSQLVLVDFGGRLVEAVAVGSEPVAFVALPAHDKIFVANRSGNSLSIIGLSRRRVLDSVDVRSKPVLLALP